VPAVFDAWAIIGVFDATTGSPNESDRVVGEVAYGDMGLCLSGSPYIARGGRGRVNPTAPFGGTDQRDQRDAPGWDGITAPGRY
jgi:hypothetical protein